MADSRLHRIQLNWIQLYLFSTKLQQQLPQGTEDSSLCEKMPSNHQEVGKLSKMCIYIWACINQRKPKINSNLCTKLHVSPSVLSFPPTHLWPLQKFSVQLEDNGSTRREKTHRQLVFWQHTTINAANCISHLHRLRRRLYIERKHKYISKLKKHF